MYLGHIVGSGLVQPEEGKVAAIHTFPIPQSKQQIRAFLGLAGYYRKNFTQLFKQWQPLLRPHMENVPELSEVEC